MKDIIILQGKQYISAKRASTISDYTSDYIGQLCRAKKLDCTRIGHAWFVHEESLFSHKAKVAQDLEAERKRFTQVADNQISSKVVLQEYRDHGTFLPPLKKERPIAPVVITPKVSQYDAKRSVFLTTENAAPAIVPVETKSEFSSAVRSTFVTAGMLVFVSILFVSSLFLFTRSPRIVAVGSSSAGVYDALQSISIFFQNEYLALRSMFSHDRQLAINTTSSSDFEPQSAQGMAVINSTGDVDADAAMKQQIQQSFSDQVEIHPDTSGTGGVITPVFKTAKGDDFVYVLVPVKDKSAP